MNPRIEQLKEFLKEDPTDSFLIYALSLEYAKEDNPNQAIETLLNLIEKDELNNFKVHKFSSDNDFVRVTKNILEINNSM